MHWDALALALAQHEVPARVPELRQRALPQGMTALLRAALGQDEVLTAAGDALRVGREQLVDAARFFIEQQVLAREFEADPWRQLGLAEGADEATLKIHHRLLVRLVHPDRSDDWAEAYADRVNRAWRQLRGRAPAVAAIATEASDWGRPAAHVAVAPIAQPLPPWEMAAPRRRRGRVAAVVVVLGALAFALVRWHMPPPTVPAAVVTMPDAAVPEVSPPPPARPAPWAADAAAPVPLDNLLSEARVAALPPTPPVPASVVPAKQRERTKHAEPVPEVAPVVVAAAATEPAAVDVAVAVAAMATPSPAEVAVPLLAPSPTPPSDRETLAFLDRYAAHYAAGDLDGVMALFAHAVHDDSHRFAPIASWHSRAFHGSARRELQLHDVRWQRHPDRIVGEARYQLRLQARGGATRRSEHGRIEFELVSEHGTPRLTQWVARPEARS
jgi:hypothetical protein